MERLTEDYNDSYCLKKCHPNNDSFCDGDGRGCPIDNCGVVIEALNKLGEYEKAEEQGLLVRLPCKVGDTVYVPNRVLVSEFKITAIFCDILGTFFYWLFYCGIYERTIGFSERDIGKTVFLTRKEAEKKLEEMKNGR